MTEIRDVYSHITGKIVADLEQGSQIRGWPNIATAKKERKKESRDALRPPQTHPAARPTAITRSERCP
jgi:hypothetical protein